MNKRQLFLAEQKQRNADAAIAEADERAVETREKTLTYSWVAAGISTVATIGGILSHGSHPEVGLTVCAGLWMSALHVTDTMSTREVPGLLRWAIYAFGVVSSVILIASFFHGH